jgi:hypothetical protein
VGKGQGGQGATGESRQESRPKEGRWQEGGISKDSEEACADEEDGPGCCTGDDGSCRSVAPDGQAFGFVDGVICHYR